METPDHIRSILKNLPQGPGVYQYFDVTGNILYVGKAKNLKNRVSSYFVKNLESGKTRVLVQKIQDIKYIVVESEMDALLLENSLIKKYQPRYNINLKDDKTYPSIVIRREPFPRIYPTRQVVADGSEYHGPYTSARVMYAVLDLVKKLYPIRTCNLKLTESNIKAGKFKVCLEYHLGNCLGPCEGKQNKEEYDNNVEQVRRIIRGNFSAVAKEWKSLMQKASGAYQFEEAQRIKEKLEILEGFEKRSTVVNPSIDNVDVFTIASDSNAGYVNYLKVNKGSIVQGHTVELKKKMEETDEELLEFAIVELRNRFNSSSTAIYTSVELSMSMDGIIFFTPQKGDKKKLIDLSRQNAVHFMLDAQKQQQLVDPDRHNNRVMETVKKDLHLQDLPLHIECFDNSNIQGTNPVSACVVFKNGKPSKSDYRKFNVKGVEGPDDFATMKEVVYRRYHRLLEEGESLPQLIIIDGGKGQLGAALESLEQLGLRGKIAMIGIAKRLEEIYFPGDSLPLYLDKKSESLRLIQHMRNEAHRFGISHHRDRRSKDALTSELNGIKGVGPQSATALLSHFRSVKKIAAATMEELEQVVGKSMASKVFDHFNHR